MAKKPNAMGRIEADPKPPKNFHMKEIALFLLAVALLVSGIVGTLKYQEFINGVKAQGVSEYKANKCSVHSFEDKSATWFECEPKKLENNQ